MSRTRDGVRWQIAPTAQITWSEGLVPKRPVTDTDLVRLRQLADTNLEEDDAPLDQDLFGYATEGIVNHLLQNWTAAAHDDPAGEHFTSVDVLSDLDRTMDQIRRYIKEAHKVLSV